MTSIKEKTPPFLLGLLVGLTIAGCFFVFKLDDYFEKLKLYKNITKTFYLYDKNKEANVSDTKEGEKQAAAELKTSEAKSKKQLKANTDKTTDSSAFAGDTVSSPAFGSDDFVIEKDQMTSALVLVINNLSALAASEKQSDSLLHKVSGVRDDKNETKRVIAVELWKSPLNYKGYKMSKNKLILYGIAAGDDIKLYKLNDVVYLKTITGVYKLENTYDYKAYQHVNDAELIAKLK